MLYTNMNIMLPYVTYDNTMNNMDIMMNNYDNSYNANINNITI
jgi:hypothetical protein